MSDFDSELTGTNWRLTRQAPPLPPGGVHLWRFQGDIGSFSRSDWEPILSGEEKGRVHRFHFTAHGRRYACHHVFLRRALSLYTGIEPDELEFETGPKGKPALGCRRTPGDIRFNLSHSGDAAVLAVASGIEVGIDVERIQKSTAMDAVAEYAYSLTEQRWFAGRDPAERPRAFYTLWTRKEALIKAAGAGLTELVSRVDVLGADPVRRIRFDGLDWWLEDVACGADLSCAVCARSGQTAISLSRWALDG